MRLRRRPTRNRKSACLARISARPQHSVYPAVSHNDNHRRSEPGHRFRKTRCDTAPLRCRRRSPAILRVSRTGNVAVDAGAWGREQRITRRQRRRPAIAGPPAPVHARQARRLRSRGRSGRLSGDFRNRRAGHHRPGPGNEGVGEHVRTRFHLRALDPGEIADQ